MGIGNKIAQLYAIKEVIGISVTLGQDVAEYSLLRVQRDRDGITFQEAVACQHLDEVIDYCARYPRTPIGLHVQGRGVLIREVPLHGPYTQETVQEVFPSFSTASHYSSHLDGATNRWIALAKKERIDPVWSSLLDSGIKVVQVCIGPFVLDAVLSHLNAYHGEYLFAGHHIKRDGEGMWTDYVHGEQYTAKFQTKIGIDRIEQTHIPSFAMAFHVLMADYITDYGLDIPAVQQHLEEAKGGIRFRVNGLAMLVAVFFLLLVSTTVYTTYYQKNEILRSSSSLLTSVQQDWNAQQSRVEHQDSLLVQLGWNGGIPKAWLLDRIGSSLDFFPGIYLSDIQINPKVERRRGQPERAAVDNRNTIVLQGSCATLEALNVLVRELSKTSWVDKVRVEQFTPSPKYGDTDHVFRLDITFGYEG